jgi:hypothetical protein
VVPGDNLGRTDILQGIIAWSIDPEQRCLSEGFMRVEALETRFRAE